MSISSLPSERIAVVANIDPDAYTAATYTSDWVDMKDDGTVYVNQTKLKEPYLKHKAYGQTNIKFPYQVPEDRIFVMGDNREVSIDSRNTSIGTVSDEQLVGKLIFRIWPLSDIGTLN